MPGVGVKAVGFDHSTIYRGGAEEQVFLDQSQPAPVAAPESSPPPPPVAGMDNPSADMLKRDVGFTPRMQHGRVPGLILTARGPGFQQAGLHPRAAVPLVAVTPIGSRSDGRRDREGGGLSCSIR